jgi:cytochrome P450 family 4
MRLFPSIPFIFRTNVEDIELDGHEICEGSFLFVSIFSIQRNKDFWGEDAEKFDPDRFSPERTPKEGYPAFIPFSLGRRNCPGKQYSNLSMKIVLAKLVQNFELSTELKYEDITLINDITLSLNGPCLIKVTKR